MLVKEFTINNYISNDEIIINLPKGIIIHFLQIDTTTSIWAKYFDLQILQGGILLTTCKLDNPLLTDMLIFNMKNSTIKKLTLIFKPHYSSKAYQKATLVVGDEIIIKIIGQNEEEEEGGDYSSFFWGGDF
tara:strand:+ start:509 stop:901 length:393 start_codon:yes stop_codon:yes gene_type:complete